MPKKTAVYVKIKFNTKFFFCPYQNGLDPEKQPNEDLTDIVNSKWFR